MSKFTSPAKLEMLGNYRFKLIERFEYYTALDLCDVHHGRARCTPEQAASLDLRPDIRRVRNEDVINLGGVWLIDIHAGYVTDLASVPRPLWAIFPPHGAYAKAAIVHDYLYSNAVGTKRWADRVFLEAMAVLGVPRWRRHAMYWAVRIFGKGHYH